MLNKEKFGNMCRKYREEKGITQGEIAKFAGVTQPSVSRFEKGLQENEYLTLIYMLYIIPMDYVEDVIDFME